MTSRYIKPFFAVFGMKEFQYSVQCLDLNVNYETNFLIQHVLLTEWAQIPPDTLQKSCVKPSQTCGDCYTHEKERQMSTILEWDVQRGQIGVQILT